MGCKKIGKNKNVDIDIIDEIYSCKNTIKRLRVSNSIISIANITRVLKNISHTLKNCKSINVYER